MAETTGVTNTPENRNGKPGGKLAPFVRKNKLLVYGGGGVGVLLLMSRAGKKAAGGSQSASYDQLQAASDAAAAQAAANNPYLTDPGLLPGGVAPVDTGGGSYTQQGPSATTAPALGPINVAAPDVTVITPPVASAPGAAPAASKAKAKAKPKPKAKPKAKAKPHKAGTPAAHKKVATKPPAKPSQPHPTKPAPADHAGKHPATSKKTAKGNKKQSPVEVEAMVGAGAGIVIHGRHFPGARSHREGAPMVSASGEVTRPVTVDYGGHTETMLSHNNGERWTDRPHGMNPPSRGVPEMLPGRNMAML